MMLALDLDGVIWLGSEPIPGSSAAVAELRAGGFEVIFVTNNSSAPTAEVEEKLASMGVPASGAVVTSGTVVASLVQPGERVLCCGGPGLAEALRARGAEVMLHGQALGELDTVVVGYHQEFDYWRMAEAATAVRGGARLLASNDDATYPTEEGLLPGCGSILAGIERASGATAVVAGKPNAPMAEYLRATYGADGTMVGDRLDTDGGLARAMGWRFGLVLTGVADAADGDASRADFVANSLADLVPALLASRP